MSETTTKPKELEKCSGCTATRIIGSPAYMMGPGQCQPWMHKRQRTGMMLENKTPPAYEVTVGNVGRVYAGTDCLLAVPAYHQYIGRSVAGEGRAAGESVVLWKDGEPWSERG